DVARLMRDSDVLVLPSLEEGSALVCGEAIGSGCVPLVSDAASGICSHQVNALIHPAGDIDSLERDITMVHSNRVLLRELRARALASASDITWASAGRRLLRIYADVTNTRRDCRLRSEGAVDGHLTGLREVIPR
ncbi:MAG: glycosyltransferase, partial [Candidatus Binatia bacterium]